MRLVSLLLGILAALAVVLAVMAGVGLLLWSGLLIWASPEEGGGRSTAQASRVVEVCGGALAGSNTVGEKLAPALLADYLRSANFEVGPAEEIEPGEIRLVGQQEGRRCTVTVRSHGSGDSFKELQAGSALIGMSSRAIKIGEIEALNAAGAGDFAAESSLAEHVIALDGIAIIVHPENPLREMALADVRAAFLGQISQWGEVGAPPGLMRLYARDDVSGTFQFFHERVLGQDPAWEQAKLGAQRFESSSELVAAVAADPLAVGFVGVAYVNDTVRALAISDGGPAIRPTTTDVRAESYPISRRLFLYTRPETLRSNRFVAGLVRYFKSSAAYERVEELRYVSLKPFDAAEAQEASVAGCEPGAAEAIVYARATQGARRLSSVFRFLPASNSLDSLGRDDLGRSLEEVRRSLGAGAVVRLIGHSDAEGDAAINRRLARERAEAVRLIYEAQGVLGVQVDSAGEMCPIADNATPAGRQSNRRVEVWIADAA